MLYSAEISRSNPTCFVFVVDQSASMSDQIGGGEIVSNKATVVSDAINRLLTELAVKCAKEEGVRDYFHVAVIGYGQSVGSAFQGALQGRDLVPLSELASQPLRVDEKPKKIPDGAGGVVEVLTKFPVWIEPMANNGTPMCQALSCADRIVSKWVESHPNCFPPIVLNLTDGEANDGDPLAVAGALQARASIDGQALLFNLHVSAASSQPIVFPDSEGSLPDQYAKSLFTMSSVLPPHMCSYARQLGFNLGDRPRGFVYNADVAALVQFLDIGTRAKELR